MNIRLVIVLMLSGVFIGGAMAIQPAALGDTGKKLRCGGAGGANNGTCPDCLGNCNFAYPGQAQKYKVCEGEGDKCADTVDSKCSGVLMDGGTDGQDCDGKVVMDDTGVLPITCQNNSFKTCK